VRIGEKAGLRTFSLLREVEKIKRAAVPSSFVAKIRKELWVLRGKTLAVWGLAFKAQLPMTCALLPALGIIRRFWAVRRGQKCGAYDPEAMHKAQRDPPGNHLLR